MSLALPAGTRGQLLALAMTLLAAIAVWAGAITPLLDWYGDRAELLRRQQAIARRMESLAETLPALRLEASRLNVNHTAGAGPDTDLPTALLPGATDPLAAASLQQRVDAFATTAGVRIGSEEILPAQTDGDLRAISVRLTMTAPYSALVALLLGLTRSETTMVVDELLMRGLPGKGGGEEVTVDASLIVTSYRSAKADAR
jgi:hypothetical protein